MVRFSIILCFLFLSGFTSVNGVIPLSPEIGHPKTGIKTVESLQPVFRWEKLEDNDLYELVIYGGPYLGSFYPEWRHWEEDVGNIVYFKENIKGVEHHLEKPLEAGRIYFWSVRVAPSEEEVPEWSTYNYRQKTGETEYSKDKIRFRFMTPGEPLELTLQYIDKADPKEDFKEAIRKKDFRFIGVYGLALTAPGVEGFYGGQKNLKVIQGTSDYILGEEHSRLNNKATDYAKEYNRLMVDYLSQRGH